MSAFFLHIHNWSGPRVLLVWYAQSDCNGWRYQFPRLLVLNLCYGSHPRYKSSSEESAAHFSYTLSHSAAFTQTAREIGCWRVVSDLGRSERKWTSSPASSTRTAVESGSRARQLRSFTSSTSSCLLQGTSVTVLRSYRHSAGKWHSIKLRLTVAFYHLPE